MSQRLKKRFAVPCTTFKAMQIGCAMPNSAIKHSSWVRVSSKPAAKPLSGIASSNPACNGLFEVPMTSSLCAACNSAADGKSSGKLEQRVSLRCQQICRAPSLEYLVDRFDNV